MLILPRVKRFVNGKIGRKDREALTVKIYGGESIFMASNSFKVQSCCS